MTDLTPHYPNTHFNHRRVARKLICGTIGLFCFWILASGPCKSQVEDKIRQNTKESLEILLDTNRSFRERARAADNLARPFDEEDKIKSVKALVAVLQQDPENASLRASCAGSLARLTPINESSELNLRMLLQQEALPELLRILSKQEKEDNLVRIEAAEAIGSIQIPRDNKKQRDESETYLLSMLGYNHKDVIYKGADVLRRLRFDDKELVQKLIRLLETTSNEDVRESVAYVFGGLKEVAIPELIETLHRATKERNEALLRGVIHALELMGPAAKGTVSELENLENANLSSQTTLKTASALLIISEHSRIPVKTLVEIVRNASTDEYSAEAAYALGRMGNRQDVDPELKGASEVLINTLKESKDSKIQCSAAFALGMIGRVNPKESIKALVEALTDPDVFVRRNAADALANVGANDADFTDAEKQYEPLISLVRVLDSEKDSDVKLSVANALAQISSALAKQEKSEKLNLLTGANNELNKLLLSPSLSPEERHWFSRHADTLHQSVEILNALKWRKLWAKVFEYPKIVSLVVLYLIILSTWWVLYLVYPVALLNMNEYLRDVKVPNPFKQGSDLFALPLNSLVLLNFFGNRLRVLDAWVEKHVKSWQEDFGEQKTVQGREIHVSLPVSLNGEAIPEINALHLRGVFEKEKSYLVITGEGGVGKTSLACQISTWAMAAEPEKRLCSHFMLPVLIEGEIQTTCDDANVSLIDHVRGYIEHILNINPSPALVETLMKRHRILVVVDRLSELENLRKFITPLQTGFPIRAMIVTSRVEETLDGVKRTTISPCRLEGAYLSLFMERYLTMRQEQKIERNWWFENREFFDACGSLAELTKGTNLTVLMARFYADQVISAKERGRTDNIPDNIPDLMLGYLDQRNSESRRGFSDEEIRSAAKAIAWCSLEKGWYPVFISEADAIEELKKVFANTNSGLADENNTKRLNDRAKAIVEEFEKYLGLIQRRDSSSQRFRFVLDPLAEFLAALFLLNRNESSSGMWNDFRVRLLQITDPELLKVKGFLQAVYIVSLSSPDEQRLPSEIEGLLATRLCMESHNSR